MEPMTLRVSRVLAAGPLGELPDPIHTIWSGAVKRAQELVATQKTGDMQAYCERISALVAHFGLDMRRPGWDRDLALSLAIRHEREALGERGTFISAVFRKYDLDPTTDDDFSLALQIAFKHVPGFSLRPPDEVSCRLTVLEFVRFFIAVAAIREHAKASGTSFSDRQVAEILLNKNKLSQVLPPIATDKLCEIISGKGNRKRLRKERLSGRTIRQYLVF